jgi:hypothetical protein
MHGTMQQSNIYFMQTLFTDDEYSMQKNIYIAKKSTPCKSLCKQTIVVSCCHEENKPSR